MNASTAFLKQQIRKTIDIDNLDLNKFMGVNHIHNLQILDVYLISCVHLNLSSKLSLWRWRVD
jgi:hypothetical protein